MRWPNPITGRTADTVQAAIADGSPVPARPRPRPGAPGAGPRPNPAAPGRRIHGDGRPQGPCRRGRLPDEVPRCDCSAHPGWRQVQPASGNHHPGRPHPGGGGRKGPEPGPNPRAEEPKRPCPPPGAAGLRAGLPAGRWTRCAAVQAAERAGGLPRRPAGSVLTATRCAGARTRVEAVLAADPGHCAGGGRARRRRCRPAGRSCGPAPGPGPAVGG